MIRPVIEDFEDRVLEVERHLAVLQQLDDPDMMLVRFDKSGTEKFAIDSEWLSAMKATAFLMIYNLVESAMRKALGAVYGVVRREGRKCAELSQEMRDIWVNQQYRKYDPLSASPRTYNEAARIIVGQVLDELVLEFDERRFPGSGNLDADRIRRICSQHGISGRTHYRAAGGGSLQQVLRQRNILAHGDLSFCECGRAFTVAQLVETEREVAIFMRSILRNTADFIDRKTYVA